MLLDSDSRSMVRKTLAAERRRLTGRVARIEADVRHGDAPLDADADEQAVELENDPVLDALDERGRRALAEIDAALHRLDQGTYGVCTRCEAAISRERLLALPTAATCASCAT
jgi:RNA polymerase-binding protein DksA